MMNRFVVQAATLFAMAAVGFLAPACDRIASLVGSQENANAVQVEAAVRGDGREAVQEGKNEAKPEGGPEGEQHDERVLAISPEQARLAEIQTTPVVLGEIDIELRVPGEVRYNENGLAHITPRVEGIVTSVRKTLGDRVKGGDLLAVLESRELAEAKAGFLAAGERLELARVFYKREKALWEKKISAEQDYLSARQAYNEARIAFRASEKQLHAIGLSDREVKALSGNHKADLARYELRAPFTGTVVTRHITKGERVGTDTALYTIADLRSAWVIANVYEPDIGKIRPGQPASISVKAYPDRSFRGKVTWIASAIHQETRTLPIRVEVDNPGQQLKSGMFADVVLRIDTERNVLTVPSTALRNRKNQSIVFVARGNGTYEPREITIGRRSATRVAVKDGVRAGERVVTNGSFLLLSELEKGGF